jgi:hypothetical protein
LQTVRQLIIVVEELLQREGLIKRAAMPDSHVCRAARGKMLHNGPGHQIAWKAFWLSLKKVRVYTFNYFNSSYGNVGKW